jgi:cbb3-type cytochrome oxidase subunit 3
MYTRWNLLNSTAYLSTNDSHSLILSYPSSSPAPPSDTVSSVVLIVILSILCFLGVIFMIFGPMMRSEAWKRADNYIFGEDREDEYQGGGGMGHGDE